MVTHANLIANVRAIRDASEATVESTVVTWLPLFHDMGLIGNVLQSLYVGSTTVLMPPTAFLQKPLRWIHAVSRYRAYLSGAPNFAYDLCVQCLGGEQPADLDLNGWRVAFSGSEPIRADTLKRFTDAFAFAGFRPEAFIPCYGLAEATLYVSSSRPGALPVTLSVSSEHLERHRVVPHFKSGPGAKTLVSSGRLIPGHHVTIVDPEQLTPCAEGEVGEVWLTGPSVARGYWNSPELTHSTFAARLAGTGEGLFLRTGDLGFLHGEELFITGRLKDLLIIHGVNHYPQDIELTVGQCHPALNPSQCAAFSVDVQGGERLVIAAEVSRVYGDVSNDAIASAVREAVADVHELGVHEVVLLGPGAIPKTSSGKIQRHACRIGYIERTFELRAPAREVSADAQPDRALPGESALIDRYPQVDGIVHSALVLKDSSLMKMTEEALMDVLMPKVHGTFNLMKALQNRPPGFVLFFSSIQSFIANAGQANYTASCVAKDALASLLNDVFLVNSKVINWGFWGSVGVVAAEKYRDRMARQEIGSIEPDEGLQIVERFLKSPLDQVAVVKASDRALERLQIKPWTRKEPTSVAAPVEQIVPAYDANAPAVIHNKEVSAALNDYARARVWQTKLPERVAPRFGRLMKAIASVPYAPPVDRSEFAARWPELTGHVALLEACLESYPRILSGEVDPLSVLFPNGSFSLVEPIYRGNPIADYFNRTVADIVSRIVRSRAGRKVRIIEIGAGTGSTTQFVLPLLQGKSVEYTFTDLSHAFLYKARQRFSEFTFMKYRVLDIEKSPELDEKFDIVIATNVIHATRDLESTLRNVRGLLDESGLFVLNEVTARTDFATLTFGLTDGWWLSTDSTRIPDSPLVAGESWRALLTASGFDRVCHHGEGEQAIIRRVR
jgi:SAM-dependent methyltransferase/NAD(P)-dependent dehydrogenase (short-subunit alcohol dehydrogenase family)